jgi:hypothetical protein
VHRVVTSGHYNDTLVDVKYGWTMTDLIHAHLMLDCLADAAAQDAPAKKSVFDDGGW